MSSVPNTYYFLLVLNPPTPRLLPRQLSPGVPVLLEKRSTTSYLVCTGLLPGETLATCLFLRQPNQEMSDNMTQPADMILQGASHDVVVSQSIEPHLLPTSSKDQTRHPDVEAHGNEREHDTELGSRDEEMGIEEDGEQRHSGGDLDQGNPKENREEDSSIEEDAGEESSDPDSDYVKVSYDCTEKCDTRADSERALPQNGHEDEDANPEAVRPVVEPVSGPTGSVARPAAADNRDPKAVEMKEEPSAQPVAEPSAEDTRGHEAVSLEEGSVSGNPAEPAEPAAAPLDIRLGCYLKRLAVAAAEPGIYLYVLAPVLLLYSAVGDCHGSDIDGREVVPEEEGEPQDDDEEEKEERRRRYLEAVLDLRWVY